jgi:cytochrome c biogenesis protein CcmG, thiol:disulfide interchange protein DsbE
MQQRNLADYNIKSAPPTRNKRGWGWIMVLAIILALLSLLGYSLLNQGGNGDTKAPFTNPPPFTLELFEGYEWNGKSAISPAEVKGKPLVINFWASWCIPCRDEAPILEKLWRDYSSKGVVFLGVAFQDSRENALAFLKQYGVSYPNGPDTTGEIAIEYGTTGIPETWFIGADGKVKRKYIRPLTEPVLRKYLDELLSINPVLTK